jgi:hypothetical protein
MFVLSTGLYCTKISSCYWQKSERSSFNGEEHMQLLCFSRSVMIWWMDRARTATRFSSRGSPPQKLGGVLCTHAWQTKQDAKRSQKAMKVWCELHRTWKPRYFSVHPHARTPGSRREKKLLLRSMIDARCPYITTVKKTYRIHIGVMSTTNSHSCVFQDPKQRFSVKKIGPPV